MWGKDLHGKNGFIMAVHLLIIIDNTLVIFIYLFIY